MQPREVGRRYEQAERFVAHHAELGIEQPGELFGCVVPRPDRAAS